MDSIIMKCLYFYAVALFLALAAPVTVGAGHLPSQEVRDGIADYCASLYVDNPTQAWCRSTEVKAAERVEHRLQAGNIDPQVWQHCTGLGMGSWSALNYCIGRAEHAQRMLRR